MCIGFYVKYPLFLSGVNQIWIFSTDFRKTNPKIRNFIKIHLVGSMLYHVEQTDKRTDRWRSQKPFFDFLRTRLNIAWAHINWCKWHPNFTTMCFGRVGPSPRNLHLHKFSMQAIHWIIPQIETTHITRTFLASGKFHVVRRTSSNTALNIE
jgi:hypothetical protein